MYNRITNLVFSCLLMALTGCGSVIYKEFSVDRKPATSLSIDAKQRVLLVTNQGGQKGDKRVICAEPSPDAFRALAGSGGATLAAGGKEVGGRVAAAESAGALAVRTQTIQLLRDGLYRVCEAYMNGAIDVTDYRRILAAYDELLITLVALEGLGRQQTGPLPVLGTKSEGTKADNPDTSVSAESVLSTAQPAQSSSVIEEHTANKMYAIVRDYYCFQLAIKTFFRRDKSQTFPSEALSALCGSSQSRGK